MRAQSPREEIRHLEIQLNGPDLPARIRAARRLDEIALGSPPDSRERALAANALNARLLAERDAPLRQELERMVSGLRGANVPRAPGPAEARRQETAEPRLSERIAGAVASRILGPLALVPRTAGCASDWTYEGSVMEGETGLVREFTEELVRGETTVEGRVRRIVAWGQANLPHYHGDYSPSVYDAGHAGESSADPTEVSIRDVFQERVVGCHLAVFTLVTMLRSIGIRADYVRSESIGAGEDGHGIMHIPEIDRYVHGDGVCLSNLVPTELLIQTRENIVAYYDEYLNIDPYNPPESFGPVSDEFRSHVHSGGFLRRDGDSLFIEGGVVHAGYEETEFPRLQAMFPDYEITPGPPRPDGFGTTFTTRRVPITPLE